MSYGAGYILIPDKLKDRRFGISFVVRRLNPEQVSDVVRRRPDGRERTDSTLVAAGAPVWTLGITENVEIIRRIGGRAKDLKTTFGARDVRQVNVEGSTGLRTRYAVDPHKLIADIRDIHVKHASGSAPLSHLFLQGLVSAETLMASSAARKQFASAVAALSRGWSLPGGEAFRPRKGQPRARRADAEDARHRRRSDRRPVGVT
jgi:hypothetical protein